MIDGVSALTLRHRFFHLLMRSNDVRLFIYRVLAFRLIVSLIA